MRRNAILNAFVPVTGWTGDHLVDTKPDKDAGQRPEQHSLDGPHRTLNPQVLGSNPRGRTQRKSTVTSAFSAVRLGLELRCIKSIRASERDAPLDAPRRGSVSARSTVPLHVSTAVLPYDVHPGCRQGGNVKDLASRFERNVDRTGDHQRHAMPCGAREG